MIWLNGKFVLLVSALALVVAASLWGIVKIRSWFRERDDPAASANQMLSQYREMHQRGDLSEEEYRLIKSRLTHQLRRDRDSPVGAG